MAFVLSWMVSQSLACLAGGQDCSSVGEWEELSSFRWPPLASNRQEAIFWTGSLYRALDLASLAQGLPSRRHPPPSSQPAGRATNSTK